MSLSTPPIKQDKELTNDVSDKEVSQQKIATPLNIYPLDPPIILPEKITADDSYNVMKDKLWRLVTNTRYMTSLGYSVMEQIKLRMQLNKLYFELDFQLKTNTSINASKLDIRMKACLDAVFTAIARPNEETVKALHKEAQHYHGFRRVASVLLVIAGIASFIAGIMLSEFIWLPAVGLLGAITLFVASREVEGDKHRRILGHIEDTVHSVVKRAGQS